MRGPRDWGRRPPPSQAPSSPGVHKPPEQVTQSGPQPPRPTGRPPHAERPYPGGPGWKTPPMPSGSAPVIPKKTGPHGRGLQTGAPPEGEPIGWVYVYPYPPTPPNGGVTPPVEGMVLVFEDTFRTGTLDQGRWWTRYIYDGPDGPGTLDYLNDEWERFRETGNHVLTSTGLQLTGLPHNGDFWPSGMVRSKPIFDLASGKSFYFECRAKVPRGLGVWPAFWLSADAQVPGNVQTVRWPPEIDIMEIVNNGHDDTTKMLGARCQVLDWTNNPQQYTWTQTADGFNGDFSVWYAPFDFADDFHVFGLLYERPNFTIYCDRGLILSGTYDWVWDDRSPAPPAHVLVNFAIGGSWAGRYGCDNEAFPQAYEVDYVRVWCAEQVTLPQDIIGKDYQIS